MITVRLTEEFVVWTERLRDRRALAAIASRLRRMETGNFGDVSPVGEGVSELRIHIGAGYRVYFVQRGEQVVILLCGGDKSSQSRDITKAIRMSKEV